jgi:hypothetical protein
MVFFIQKHLAKWWTLKYNVTSYKHPERAPLDLCIDPQFEHFTQFIKRVEPTAAGKESPATIYDEVDPKMMFELYGRMLPVKVDAWSTDPARYENHFGPNK